MIFYRIKQFYTYINAKITEEDKKYLNKNLNSVELELFKKLSKNEQKHCINVAYCIEKACREYDNHINLQRLIKAALLHDIGKSCKRLNVFEKSIIVVLDNFTKGAIKRYENFPKIGVYYNHGEMGYEILKKYNCYEDKLLYLIRNHHNDSIKDDIELNILKKCDSNN
jgi:putative nucleotidyltransferase with HDIG domain